MCVSQLVTWLLTRPSPYPAKTLISHTAATQAQAETLSLIHPKSKLLLACSCVASWIYPRYHLLPPSPLCPLLSSTSLLSGDRFVFLSFTLSGPPHTWLHTCPLALLTLNMSPHRSGLLADCWNANRSPSKDSSHFISAARPLAGKFFPVCIFHFHFSRDLKNKRKTVNCKELSL